MPAYLPSAGLGCKLVSLFPGNTDRHTHQAAIILIDPERGHCRRDGFENHGIDIVMTDPLLFG